MGTSAPSPLFPTEMELCEIRQVSHHITYEVLRGSAEQGLISRRKGAGTRVCEPKASGINRPLSYPEDLLLLAKNSLRVIKRTDEAVADAELSQMIGRPSGSCRLYTANTRGDTQNSDTPICWTGGYVSTDYAKLRTYIHDDPHLLINDLIEAYCGVKSHEARQTATVVDVFKKVAKIFNIAPDSPTMRTVCCYLDRDGKAFEMTISIHPTGRYTCSIVLKS